MDKLNKDVLCSQWLWEAASAGHKRNKSIIHNFMLQLLVLSRQILLLSRGEERMCFCFKIKARLIREPMIGAGSTKQAFPVIYPVLSLIAKDLQLTGKQIKQFIVIKVSKLHNKRRVLNDCLFMRVISVQLIVSTWFLIINSPLKLFYFYNRY